MPSSTTSSKTSMAATPTTTTVIVRNFVPKVIIFALTFISHHRWSSHGFSGKMIDEGNTLLHVVWSQGGDFLKWEDSLETPSSSSTSSQQRQQQRSGDEGDGDWLRVLSDEKEPFQCSIPKVRGSPKERSQVYDGPSPLTILNELFHKSSCSYRIESYWTYEVCHGKYIRQYHESKDSGKQTNLQEYYLGRYDHALQTDVTRAPNAELPKIPLKKVEDQIVPYFEVVMTEGTSCDLEMGVPRRTSLLYVCSENGRNEIAHLEETSTCAYTIVIYSPLLCAHPYYQREEPTIQNIHCYGKDGGKPKKLADLERAHRLWTSSGAAATEDSGGGDEDQRAPQPPVDGAVLEPAATVAASASASASEATASATVAEPSTATKAPTASTPTEEPASPVTMLPQLTSQSSIGQITDRQWIEGFFAGENCVQGGTGYWKHELCYRKHARQFHRERDGSRLVITLGIWDVAEHRAWVTRHPQKKVKRALSISNLYSGGDHCDAKSRPRTVEVKLKCKSDGDPHSVSIYLLEPEICEYIMGVESPLFCNVVDKATPDGLLPDIIAYD